jgi:5-methylthioribose kinase
MANQADTYVIDAEFAFFGPMGFDVGALIGNLYMNYFSHAYQWHLQGEQCQNYRQWLLDSIEQIWLSFEQQFRTQWLEHEVKSGRQQWAYPGGMEDFNAFIDSYMAELFADTIGFAACKMMRRVVGLAKVADFADIEDLAVRATIETHIINMASEMIVKRDQFSDIQALNALAITTNPVEALICGPQQ